MRLGLLIKQQMSFKDITLDSEELDKHFSLCSDFVDDELIY